MSCNNKSEVSRAAQLIVAGRSGEGLYETFKEFQRSNADDYTEKLPDPNFDHPEIAGYIASGALVQIWRNRNQQNSHLMAVGNLETGKWGVGKLMDVTEQPYGDYSQFNAFSNIDGVNYEIHASPETITLSTLPDEGPDVVSSYPVKDYVELDREVYHESRRQRAERMQHLMQLLSRRIGSLEADSSEDSYRQSAA